MPHERNRGWLTANNIPTIKAIDSGYFTAQHRSYFLRNTNIQRWYVMPMITAKGMAVLAEIDRELTQAKQTRAA